VLDQWLRENRPARIGDAEHRQILDLLAPTSDSYLRRLLRSCGVPLEPLVEGVRQDSYDDLERTLLALGQIYEHASEQGDRELATRTRREVLTAKEHARLAARSRRASAEVQSLKQEMISWMTVWLEDPSLFPTWLRLRKRVLFDSSEPRAD
jgi:hypothetical protein